MSADVEWRLVRARRSAAYVMHGLDDFPSGVRGLFLAPVKRLLRTLLSSVVTFDVTVFCCYLDARCRAPRGAALSMTPVVASIFQSASTRTDAERVGCSRARVSERSLCAACFTLDPPFTARDVPSRTDRHPGSRATT